MKTKSRITAILLSVTMIFAMAPILSMSAGTAYADEIPTADETINNDWEGTLIIDQNKTVKIKDVTHENTTPDSGAAIKIPTGVTANLVFEGENTLIANPNVICAGIEVAEGATVNIYGVDGSSLEVTGGDFSAGIGGKGYDSPSTKNPVSGNINIFSGTITAIGGNKGAGIGSGYHSSASVINIYGGNITALGTGCGAGIGTGYGTTGGAARSPDGEQTGSGIGYYHGGNITISGGTVRAAGYHMNFNTFNPYDPATLYADGYSNSWAAGIGGGYGASSGNIIIKGDADVISIGSCGGAGIGTGRGTSKADHFDQDAAHCQVSIRGNAKVIAMTTKDTRTTAVGDTGAAGIGLGRGWGLKADVNGNVTPNGTVAIEENANVYAYAAAGANGIGASCVVDKFTKNGDIVNYPVDEHLESLTIGPDCTIVAICDEPLPARAAIDEVADLSALSATELAFDESYFENAGVGTEAPFFKDEMFPIEVEARLPGEKNSRTVFSLSHAGTIKVAVKFPASADAYYKINQYTAANGVGVLLAHSDQENGWKYAAGTKDVTALQYEKFGITYNLNGGTNAAGNPADYAVYGPAVTLKAPSRAGYTFGGWFDNAKLKGSAVKTIPVGSVGEKQFWAKWTKNASGVLLTKMTAKGKKNLAISWNQIKGAKGYDIFFARCNKSDKSKLKKIKTIKGGKNTQWTKTGLKKKTAYKVYIRAWTMKDGKKSYIVKSPLVHAYTSGGTKYYTNPKSVTVNKQSIALKKGKTFQIKAQVNKLSKNKKLMPKGHEPTLRYLSSNNKVAAVSKTGKITAKGKGNCKVYVFAVNGVGKTIKVTVK